MKLPRRTFLHLAAGAAALPVVPRIAFAQTYPTRPVRIIVGFPAGGTGDISARLIGQWLSERLGQTAAGAAGNIAAEAVVRAPADGYTMLLVVATKIKARLADVGATALLGSPADFGKFIADETEKWGKVVRAADIKPE